MKDALYISKRQEIESGYCNGINTKFILCSRYKTIKPSSRVAFLFFRGTDGAAEFIAEFVIVRTDFFFQPFSVVSNFFRSSPQGADQRLGKPGCIDSDIQPFIFHQSGKRVGVLDFFHGGFHQSGARKVVDNTN